MSTTTFELPKDFLKGPAPNPEVKRVDWSKTQLPEKRGMYAVVLDGILSPEECKQLVRAAEVTSGGIWERAMVNAGGGQQIMLDEVRKCGRIIWDEQEILDRIWARCKPLVPEVEELTVKSFPSIVRRGEHFRMTRLNDRMRILKYTGGEYFKPHYDGQYITPDGTEQSFMTLHLYLNDDEHQEDGQRLVGGATTFWSSWGSRTRLDVNPKIGSILIFQHPRLLHSGDDVISGTKITMRTDLMYETV